MKFKVKDMDIGTGGPLVAILNEKDALKFDLHHTDRIKVIKGRKIETVVVDIAESSKAVPQGSIGLFEEVIDSLKLKNNDIVSIKLARKPLSIEFIKKKLDGIKLTKKEIDQIVWDIVHNKLSAVELTYFVAACYMQVMSSRETILLTKAMVEHGDTLKIDRYPIIDKHCIGGIPGNRTTPIVVPIIAAAGLIIPKSSSRAITSAAGTADVIESIARVDFNFKEVKKIIQKTGACLIWGGSLGMVPADSKIIKVEKDLKIDPEAQLLASILAKKLAFGSKYILIDIPYGKHAKVSKMCFNKW